MSWPPENWARDDRSGSCANVEAFAKDGALQGPYLRVLNLWQFVEKDAIVQVLTKTVGILEQRQSDESQLACGLVVQICGVRVCWHTHATCKVVYIQHIKLHV